VGVVRWLRRKGYEVAKVQAFGGEASIIALLAASVEQAFPAIVLEGLPRTLKDAPGLMGQMRYTAWAPGLALATDIPQLIKGLRDRVTVKRWLKPGAEERSEGYT